MSENAAKNARELLLKEYRGVLSTHSKSMPGFPFGSVVPYCLDAQGRPLILISRIAQHTHNLQREGKCSLLVGERGAEDVQAAGRLTMWRFAKICHARLDKGWQEKFPYFCKIPETIYSLVNIIKYSLAQDIHLGKLKSKIN